MMSLKPRITIPGRCYVCRAWSLRLPFKIAMADGSKRRVWLCRVCHRREAWSDAQVVADQVSGSSPSSIPNGLRRFKQRGSRLSAA